VQAPSRVTCLACLFLLATLETFVACSRSAPERTAKKGSETLTQATLAKATAGQFQPVPLPDPGIPGNHFPEAEDTIEGWSRTNNQQAIDLHAWGLWTALTKESDQVFNGQKLLVFETWDDPSDLSLSPPTAAGTRVRRPRRLTVPRQFQHGAAAQALFTAASQPGAVRVDVKYDPTAADFILNNSLLSAAKLTSYLNTDHKTAVPAFPNTAVSLKPTYRTLKPLVYNRYYMLKVWPGPPPLVFNQTSKVWESKAFPDSLWGQCVWIDIQGSGNTGAGVDKTCAANGSSRTPANTYGIDQFIYFQMTQADADQVNAAGGGATPVSAGDYAVLVGMHATSREITRWTWQTFWWVNAPDDPAAPSSRAIASHRPAQLSGAARHYAQCAGYDEEVPPQPNSGGSNTGETVYCYNPYLEAPFSPPVLPDSQPGDTRLNGRTVKTANNVGVQTNCMSCHEQANYNPNNVATAPQYTGARYVDLNGTAFNGVLKVDFLWSLPDNAK
jgi:hypothetical protein